MAGKYPGLAYCVWRTVGIARPDNPFTEKNGLWGKLSLVGTYAAPFALSGVCLVIMQIRDESDMYGVFTRFIGVTRTDEGRPVRTALERDALVPDARGTETGTRSSSIPFQYSMHDVAAWMVTRIKNRNIRISSGDINNTSKRSYVLCWRYYITANVLIMGLKSIRFRKANKNSMF